MKRIVSFVMAILILSGLCLTLAGCPDRAMAPKEEKKAETPAK